MKKIVLFTVMALFLGCLFPIVPQAQASVLQKIYDQALTKVPKGEETQALIRVKQDIDKGNKDDLINFIAATAVHKLVQGQMPPVMSGKGHKVSPAFVQQVVNNVGDKLGIPSEGKAVITKLLLNMALNPKIVQDSNSLAGPPANYRKVVDMKATAYAPGQMDNGQWGNLTYLGGPIRHGVVAVDPKVIPLGSKVWVEGYGPAIAEDEGGAIVGNRIDLAFNSRQEALDYGIRPVKVFLL